MIIQKIRTIYNNVEAQLKVNGHFSRTCLEREERQGYRLSMIPYR